MTEIIADANLHTRSQHSIPKARLSAPLRNIRHAECKKPTYSYHYVERRGCWTGREGSGNNSHATSRPAGDLGMTARWLPAALAALFAFSAGPAAEAQAPAAAPNTAV